MYYYYKIVVSNRHFENTIYYYGQYLGCQRRRPFYVKIFLSIKQIKIDSFMKLQINIYTKLCNNNKKTTNFKIFQRLEFYCLSHKFIGTQIFNILLYLFMMIRYIMCILTQNTIYNQRRNLSYKKNLFLDILFYYWIGQIFAILRVIIKPSIKYYQQHCI